jgi:hypothetical protein
MPADPTVPPTRRSAPLRRLRPGPERIGPGRRPAVQHVGLGAEPGRHVRAHRIGSDLQQLCSILRAGVFDNHAGDPSLPYQAIQLRIRLDGNGARRHAAGRPRGAERRHHDHDQQWQPGSACHRDGAARSRRQFLGRLAAKRRARQPRAAYHYLAPPSNARSGQVDRCKPRQSERDCPVAQTANARCAYNQITGTKIAYAYPGDATFTPATFTTTLQVVYKTRVLSNLRHPVPRGTTLDLRLQVVGANGANISGSALSVHCRAARPGRQSPATPSSERAGPIHLSDAPKPRVQSPPGHRASASGAYMLFYKVGRDPSLHVLTFVVK